MATIGADENTGDNADADGDDAGNGKRNDEVALGADVDKVGDKTAERMG